MVCDIYIQFCSSILCYRLPVGGVILSVAMVIASIGSAIGASVKYDLGVAMFFGRTSFL